MDDREARAHALSLLKKKLKTSKQQRQCASPSELDNSPNDAVEPEEKPSGMVKSQTSEVICLNQPVQTNQDTDGPHTIEPVASTARLQVIVPPKPDHGEVAKDFKPPHMLKKLMVKWSCTRCKRECIPIREESRCLCGHRYKEHPSSKDDQRVIKNKALATAFAPFQCTATKCSCKAFFYVVAEGAWILRCRCKHKHTDHNPGTHPFKCLKSKCPCDGFDSPWVCNCDHPWNEHAQETIEKQFKPLDLFQGQFRVDELNCVQRTDLLADPMRL